MEIQVKNKPIDITKAPFRGIITEIAGERGVSRQAIQQAAKKGNPRILERIGEKVEERKRNLIMELRQAGSGNRAGNEGKQRGGGRVREPMLVWPWHHAV